MTLTWKTRNAEVGAVGEIAMLFAALILVFLTINWLHFQYALVYVIFYACVLDAMIATIIVVAGYLALLRQRGYLRPTEFILTVVAANLAILLYSVVGPTVIDRSLSVYIVEKIDQRGGAVAEAAIPDVFVKEYMPEYHLVDVRLTEQLRSGTLTLQDGCLRITPRGRFIAQTMAFYRHNFLPKRRMLMGQVTDALNDPFRNSPQRVDVKCPMVEHRAA